MSTCNCNCGNCSNCTCSETTTPCVSSVGCKSTNYAKCIYYSGTAIDTCVEISVNDNLDDVIAALAAAICEVTPADLSWNTFDYGCLDTFTTAQEFAEGISAAHCALVTRVVAVEKPIFTRCSLFTSGDYLITPGTTTLQTILEYYGDILCTLSDNDPGTITVNQGCFTSNSGITTLENYFNWVVENVCNIRTTINSSISSIEGDIDVIQDYLGTPSQLTTFHDNSSGCLSGSSTDTAYDTIELIKTKLCSLNTTVTSFPDLSAITLSWASCYAYGATASLTTQLGRIVSVLKQQKYTFSSDFTVTTGACGDSVALAASVGAFACSDLEGCSIRNLGDVDPTAPTIAECGYKLAWDNTNALYRLVEDSTFTNIGIVAKTGLFAAASSGFYFGTPVASLDCSESTDYSVGFVEDAWLDLTSYLDPDYQTSGSASYKPYIKKTWDGHIYFKGAVESVGSPAVGASEQPFANGSYTRVFTGIPAAYRPTIDSFIDLIIEYPHDTGGTPDSNLNAFVPGRLLFESATGHISVRCFDFGMDAASEPLTNYDGDHNFMLFGKAIYQ